MRRERFRATRDAWRNLRAKGGRAAVSRSGRLPTTNPSPRQEVSQLSDSPGIGGLAVRVEQDRLQSSGGRPVDVVLQIVPDMEDIVRAVAGDAHQLPKELRCRLPPACE